MSDSKEKDEYFLPLHRLNLEINEPSLSSRVQVDFGALSHVGKVRTKNEDAYLVYRTGRFWERISTNIDDSLLPNQYQENAYAMAVADGMGGLAAGEVASRTALITIVNLVLTSVKWALKLDDPDTREQEIREGITRAVEYLREADLAISRIAKREGAHPAMGTTLTATYTFADDLFLFHIGDSRAYLFRNGELVQLTRDHTFAQSLADAGVISQSDVEGHLFRHILTRAVGVHEGDVNVEIHHLKLIDGDIVLLCTDGLSDLLNANEIAGVFNTDLDSQQQCSALLKLAMDHGGNDNITAVIGRYRLHNP
jgi:PPM family protein phosphatase